MELIDSLVFKTTFDDSNRVENQRWF